MTQRDVVNGERTPLLIEATSSELTLAELAHTHHQEIEARLLERGGILFRGFGIASVAAFEQVVNAMSAERMDYVYGSTPRTHLSNRIFTATEYPQAQEIPLHNENAYQQEYPGKIAFCCLRPAAQGGATPVADMRKVGSSIGEDLMRQFAIQGVRYVRHYHPYIDVPWQQVFKTDSPSDVEAFCHDHAIDCRWLPGDVLYTAQICQGTVRHPRTGEELFFNQAHLFHISSLETDIAQSLIETFGEDRVPRNAFFGDGSEIPTQELQRVRRAFADSAVAFPWQSGDVMLLDNLQAAHGRRPFKGRREVIAALMEPQSMSERSADIRRTDPVAQPYSFEQPIR